MPALVLGCSQRCLSPEIERRLGQRAELVTRESGGAAVLSGPWLVSASLVLPHQHPWVRHGLIDSYRHLGQLHLAVLEEFAVPARALSPQALGAARAALAPNAVPWACFGGLSPWEVVNAQGRKLVGLAQRRRQSGVLLVAATLIGETDWPLLCELMFHPEDAGKLPRCTVSVEEVSGRRIQPALFAAALKRRLERVCAAGDEARYAAGAGVCGHR